MINSVEDMVDLLVHKRKKNHWYINEAARFSKIPTSTYKWAENFGEPKMMTFLKILKWLDLEILKKTK